MLHKEIPFLRIGLPLCIGIISGLYVKPDTVFLAIIIIVIIAGFITSLFFNKYLTNLIFGYSFTLSLFFAGLLLYTNEKNRITTLKPERTSFESILSDYPEEKENSYRFKIRLDYKISVRSRVPVGGSMVLYCQKDSIIASFLPGDKLVVNCTPLKTENRGNPYEFNYKFYLENQGIRYSAFITSKDIASHSVPRHRQLTHRALILRNNIIDMYKNRGITGERLALVAAITLGQKNMLEPEQKLNFMKSGVMHIMAVSGLHAMVVSMFVLNLLFFLKRRFNVPRLIITLFILWSFAFVTGLTPSVLRATLMFSFLQAGNLMKRRVNGINSVLASAFVLILIKPSVIFDLGFLLSYSAVIFIISFYNAFYFKLHCKNWVIDKIWQSTAVTIVAQAGTLPLTIMLFNRFPVYFIIANIIIVPLSSLLIITGCLVPLFYPIPVISYFFASVLNKLTLLTDLLTRKISQLPLSSLEKIGMTYSECIILTVTIYFFCYFIFNKRKYPFYYPVLFLLLLFFAGTVTDVSTKITNELIVYNTPGSIAIGVKTGRILNLYSDTSLTQQEVIRHCAILGLKIKHNTIANRNYCIKAGEKKILICDSPDRRIIESFSPSYIIITGNKPEVKNILSVHQPLQALIITSPKNSVYKYINDDINRITDTVHLVKKSGAFITRI